MEEEKKKPEVKAQARVNFIAETEHGTVILDYPQGFPTEEGMKVIDHFAAVLHGLNESQKEAEEKSSEEKS